MVKKFLKIILLLFCVYVISGFIRYYISIDIKAKIWMKYFEEEDADRLIKWFCDDIKDNHFDETLEEIEAAFEFIDGDITSCEYGGDSSGGKTKHNFITVMYYCYPIFYIKTSTGKKYTIEFRYNYIWKEKPEREGIARIRIINYKGDSEFSGDKVFVGKMYENE